MTAPRLLNAIEAAALDAPHVVHGVGPAGEYLGLVDQSLASAIAHRAPPAPTGWRWIDGAWCSAPDLAAVKAAAHAEIDRAAGAARLRYITDVPGQQAVYLRKLEQAQAYVAAGGVGQVPAYIAAEASATGQTALQAAQAIMQTAQLWDEVLSPAIEGLRIGGKRAVESAETAAAVAAVVAGIAWP